MVNEFGTTQDEPSAANEQRPHSKEEQAQITVFRDLERDFIAACNSIGSSRDLSLAITYCENATMRALRHIVSRRKAG
jgi:hypothetical protein